MDIVKEIKMTSFKTICLELSDKNVLNSTVFNTLLSCKIVIAKYPWTFLKSLLRYWKGMKVDKSVHKFAFITDKIRWALTADSKDQNRIQATVVILDCTSTISSKLSRLIQSAKANKKPFNLYKKTCCSHFYKTGTNFLDSQYLYNEAVVQTNKLNSPVFKRGKCVLVSMKGRCVPMLMKGGCVPVFMRVKCVLVFMKGRCVLVFMKEKCIPYMLYDWSYYSVTTRSYEISWYKVVDQNQYEFECLDGI